ncbi:MAG: bifunctional folylpolyglutamate synthase/dihydrofolate synthase [Ignavibacteria bacterium]|jgi:dihydrofolate synthase/folylpolyglutamate synthase|nr:bifunctional folylpolyglutamate synthase/dihydrofolate synthase [Ignavibacteria bacterium]
MENNTLDKLFAKLHGEMTHSLDRIISILHSLDNPEKSYPTIHIAGTNGKGSVCSLIASILQESGYKVGLYTSPHILTFNERIKVNGIPISDAEIEDTYTKIEKLSDKVNASFFEITSAIAFEHFRKHKVDIAIIEAGLGGRFDSTNVVQPLLSIITSIDKDHTSILGDTTEKIAFEKAGIIKQSVDVLTQDEPPEVMNQFQIAAELKDATLFINYNFPTVELCSITDDMQMILNIEFPENIGDYLDNTKYMPDFEMSPFNTSIQATSKLIGLHQAKNIQIAIFAALLISPKFNIRVDTIVKGIENVTTNTGLHFRIECIEKEPNIIIDISHNPHSILHLVKTLKATSICKWDFLFGVMKDKDIATMLSYIYPICNKLIPVSPNIERAATIDEIIAFAKNIGFTDIDISNNSVYEAAIKLKDTKQPTIICGTFFMMEDVANAFNINF